MGDLSLKVSLAVQTKQGLKKSELEVPAGASVSQALALGNVQISDENGGLSIFGLRCKADTLLSEGDRIEVALALIIDPKEARRLRAEQKSASIQRGRKHASDK